MSDVKVVFECVAEATDRSARSEQLVKELRGVNVDATDEDGYTALMYAVLRDGPDKNRAVSLLLEMGADCDIENRNGETALFMAIEEGYVYVVYQMLWLAGKNFIASNGNSSLAVARCFSSNMGQIVPLMEAWGFVDTDQPTTYEQDMDQYYLSGGCTTCGGSRCGK